MAESDRECADSIRQGAVSSYNLALQRQDILQERSLQRNDEVAALWRYEERLEECTVQREIRYVAVMNYSLKAELAAEIRRYTRNRSLILHCAALGGHASLLPPTAYRKGSGKD